MHKTLLGSVANAEIAQLVEHNLAKVRVASSSLVFRSVCPGGGMVDAHVSGACVERRAGSSPVLGTTHKELQQCNSFFFVLKEAARCAFVECLLVNV